MTSDQLRRRFVSSYVFALGLIALSAVFAHLATIYIVQAEERAASIVNISGKQRMLLQRSYALIEAEAGERGNQGHRSALEQTIDELVFANQTLSAYAMSSIQDRQLQSEADRLFNGAKGIEALLREYVRIAQQVQTGELSLEDRERVEHLALGALFEKLDQAVHVFQADAEHGLVLIKQIQLLHFAVILIIILGEAMFIFAPLMSRVLQAFEAEHKSKQEASAARHAQKIAEQALNSRE